MERRMWLTHTDTQEHSEESANIFKKECLSVADPYSTFQIWGFLAHFEHCTCLINPGCLQIELSAWKLFPSGRCVDSHFEPSFPQDCECCDPPAQSFLCPAKACANHWFFGERTHQKKQKKINGTCKSTRASRSGVTTKPIAEKSSSAVSWLDAVSVATWFPSRNDSYYGQTLQDTVNSGSFWHSWIARGDLCVIAQVILKP